MIIISSRYKEYLVNRGYIISALTAFAFLLIGLLIQYFAGTYASRAESNAVTDLILSNIRVYEVDGIFVYGAIMFWFFVTGVILLQPKTIPFTLKSIALFVVVRAIFITLTHIGPFPERAIPGSHLLNYITFDGDLFFSGHVGLPFLMSLIFWDNRYLRIIFILAAILFSFVVLMTHLHYSIDVLGAYFITYTIFHLCEMFFKKDQKLFKAGLIASGH